MTSIMHFNGCKVFVSEQRSFQTLRNDGELLSPENGDVNIQQICSCEKLARSLYKVIAKLKHEIGLHHLKDYCLLEGEK
ncbi:hypothetical protein CR513_32359, partial [Mucuna pruriens]